MKVLQILPALDAGGVERGTLEIARHLATEGHESLVVSNGGRLVARLEEDGSRHIAMPVHRKNPLSFLQVRPFRRLLEVEKPDIVHIRSRVPGWIAWLAWRGMAPDMRPRLVSTVHGFYSVNRYSAVMTRGERVIAVSESIRSYVLENYPETPPEIIRVIPRGIALEDYGPNAGPGEAWLADWQKAHPALEGKTLLLLPGRITRLKGHVDLFRLIGALRQSGHNVHGLVAGDTHPKKRAYLDELKGFLASEGLERDVTFLGHRTDIREVMGVSHIVFALSQQPESFGRTVLEAMALGKPVVGYDCGGVGELLSAFFPQGKIAPGDAAGLLRVTLAILDGDSRPTAVGDPFTLGRMCRSTMDVYRELCEG